MRSYVYASPKVLYMTILQDLKIKEFPYFVLICLIASGLISTLPSAPAISAEIILAWDANAEADLAGYGIYFRKGVPGSSYEFLAEVYVDELNDPDNPMVIITDFPDDLLTDLNLPVVNMAELAINSAYHFSLTAFDTQGLTSDFSEELCLEVMESSVVNCRSADGYDGIGGDDSDAPAEISVDIGNPGADTDAAVKIDVDSGNPGVDTGATAKIDVDSGNPGADTDSAAEIGVDSGNPGVDTGAAAEIDVDNGNPGADTGATAEIDGGSGNPGADTGADAEIGGGNGSGGGCFISASSFVFRETVVLLFSPFSKVEH